MCQCDTDPTIIQKDFPALLIIMIAIGVITALTLLGIMIYGKYCKFTRLPRSQSSAALLPSEQEEGEVFIYAL